MFAALARRPLLSTLLVLAAVGVALAWWLGGSGEKPASTSPARTVRTADGKSRAKGAVGTPRSARSLGLDAQADISVDNRPPDARRENIIREGLGTIQELKFMHPQVFDGAAKRWGEDPKVKALVAEWKDIEAGWKTQDDAAKAAQLPRMQAMWNEAMGLLRTEVEQSAREAGVK
jgi:hypothetical protein